jgi:hypothetical protein
MVVSGRMLCIPLYRTLNISATVSYCLRYLWIDRSIEFESDFDAWVPGTERRWKHSRCTVVDDRINMHWRSLIIIPLRARHAVCGE